MFVSRNLRKSFISLVKIASSDLRIIFAIVLSFVIFFQRWINNFVFKTIVTRVWILCNFLNKDWKNGQVDINSSRILIENSYFQLCGSSLTISKDVNAIIVFASTITSKSELHLRRSLLNRILFPMNSIICGFTYFTMLILKIRFSWRIIKVFIFDIYTRTWYFR